MKLIDLHSARSSPDPGEEYFIQLRPRSSSPITPRERRPYRRCSVSSPSCIATARAGPETFTRLGHLQPDPRRRPVAIQLDDHRRSASRLSTSCRWTGSWRRAWWWMRPTGPSATAERGERPDLRPARAAGAWISSSSIRAATHTSMSPTTSPTAPASPPRRTGGCSTAECDDGYRRRELGRAVPHMQADKARSGAASPAGSAAYQCDLPYLRSSAWSPWDKLPLQEFEVARFLLRLSMPGAAPARRC